MADRIATLRVSGVAARSCAASQFWAILTLYAQYAGTPCSSPPITPSRSVVGGVKTVRVDRRGAHLQPHLRRLLRTGDGFADNPRSTRTREFIIAARFSSV